MTTLDEVLADFREELQTLRRNKAGMAPDRGEEWADKIAECTEDFRRFLPEPEARLHSGRSVEWLRAKHAEWEAEGHAFTRNRVRYYRKLVLPRRADVVRARADGLAGTRRRAS